MTQHHHRPPNTYHAADSEQPPRQAPPPRPARPRVQELRTQRPDATPTAEGFYATRLERAKRRQRRLRWLLREDDPSDPTGNADRARILERTPRAKLADEKYWLDVFAIGQLQRAVAEHWIPSPRAAAEFRVIQALERELVMSTESLHRSALLSALFDAWDRADTAAGLTVRLPPALDAT